MERKWLCREERVFCCDKVGGMVCVYMWNVERLEGVCVVYCIEGRKSV